jgi:hypothetical protein
MQSVTSYQLESPVHDAQSACIAHNASSCEESSMTVAVAEIGDGVDENAGGDDVGANDDDEREDITLVIAGATKVVPLSAVVACCVVKLMFDAPIDVDCAVDVGTCVVGARVDVATMVLDIATAGVVVVTTVVPAVVEHACVAGQCCHDQVSHAANCEMRTDASESRIASC